MDELFGKIENSDIVLEGVDMTSFPMVKKLMLIEEELKLEVGEGRIQSVNSYLGPRERSEAGDRLPKHRDPLQLL